MKKRNIAEEIEAIKPEIAKHKVVSFDIFDTILLRSFSNPTDLFYYIEETYILPGFANERINTEIMIRKKIIGSEDITLSQIYDNMHIYKNAEKIEIDEEIKTLHVNRFIKPLIDYAISSNKKVILVSDMYISEKYIRDILTKNNIRYDKLYISSEIGLSKNTGNLFKHVLNDLKIEPKQMIHIGDNNYSDYIVPNTLGIKSFYIEKIINRFCNKRKCYAQYVNNNWKRSLLLMQIANKDAESVKNYWYNFGYCFAAPICFNFVKWIYQNITNNKNKITDVFFIARDGYFLKKIMDRMSDESQIKTHYVYAPRIVSLICRPVVEKGHPDYYNLLLSILSYYSSELNIDKKSITNVEEAEKIYYDNLDKINQLSLKKKEDYKNYIKSLNCGDGAIAVVDSITDKFSSQSLISSVVSNEVIGYYWNLVGSALNNKKFTRECYQNNDGPTIYIWDMMEFIMTSPEPPIREMINDKPVFIEKYIDSENRKKIYTQIEIAINDFYDDYVNNGYDYLLSNTDATILLNSFLINPINIDRTAFKKVYHSVHADHSSPQKLKPFKDKTIVEIVRNNENLYMIYLNVKKYTINHFPHMSKKVWHVINKLYQLIKK